MKSHRLKIGGKELSVEYYRRSNSKTIVFMHGLNSSMGLNDVLSFPDWKKLSKKYSLVRFDVRGHGLSQSSEEPDHFTWSNLSQDMIDLINELKLDDIVLAGSSMGAATCLYTALNLAESPIKLKALILTIPPTHGENRKRLSKLYEKFALILESKGKKAMTNYWRSLPPTEFFKREFPQSREISFNYFEEHGDALSLAAAFRGSIKSHYPSVSSLSSLDIPTLIFSRVDDPIHPVESAEFLEAHLPDVKHLRAITKEDVYKWPEQVVTFLDEL